MTMKTPEELAIDYCEPLLSDDYAKAIGREDWIGTRCVKVGEGHEMYKAFLAGYRAAKDEGNSSENSDSSDAPDLQEQLEALQQYMSVVQRKIMALQSNVNFLLYLNKEKMGESEAIRRMAQTMQGFGRNGE